MESEYERKQRLLAFDKRMRKEPSEAEHKLWQQLRRKQLDGPKFRRQVPIEPFIADFACDECQLIVEVDGEQHNDAIEYDKERTAYLVEKGWRVIRFSAYDVMKHKDYVLRSILFECRRPSP